MKSGRNFLDSRDKYLSFVRATNEKIKIAFYLARRIGTPAESPFCVLDAGAGEGTVISTFLTALHKKIPRAPIVVVAKEISIDDICILLGYLPDRFAEHPSLVFHITNMTYGEIAAGGAPGVRRFKRELRGKVSHDFGLQLMNMSDFVEKQFALRDDTAAGLRPRKKVILTLFRGDQKAALAPVLSAAPSRFDFIIASHSFRLRRPVADIAAAVVAPLLRMLKDGGKMTLIYASGRDFTRTLLRAFCPGIAPYDNAAPARLLRALRKMPECAAARVSARVSEIRYGFINLYLGRRGFVQGDIRSLWNAIVYVGQIGDGEAPALRSGGVPRGLRDKFAHIRDKTLANNVVLFRKTRAKKRGARTAAYLR